MTPNIELAKARDFGEIINDTFIFTRQNFKPLLKYFFIFCGFFLVATAATSILTQINMVRTINNFNPNSFDNGTRPSPFYFMTPTYFLSLFFTLLEYIAITVTILCYMTLYKQKQNQAPELDEMWGYIKYYFLKIFGSAIVLTILIIVALMFCLIPGIYLYPIMALVFPIMVVENTSFNYAFGHSFKLIKDNWWATFGVLVVVAIVLYVATMILVVPASLLSAGSLFLHFTRGSAMSVTAVIITTILAKTATVFQILMIVASCLCYFSLTESKEGTGLIERINQFGTSHPDTNATPEEY